MTSKPFVSLALLLSLSPVIVVAQKPNVPTLTAAIRAVGPQGKGQSEAAAAWQELVKVEAAQLPAVLAGMDGANPLAVNWLRAAVDTIAARALDNREPLPAASLESFFHDLKHQPEARVTAYELIARIDDDAKNRLIPDCLDDPSMELRHQAIEMGMEAARKLDDRADDAKAAYTRLFRSARELDQAKSIAEKLEKLGAKPDLARHFGFVMTWRLIGPFDNREMKGFEIPYGPEANPTLESYAGKEGEVKWITHTTKDALGMVDLNEALGRHKGAICYAYAEFKSNDAVPCQIRIGCVNANKVWLNGQELLANNVYHSGRSMDQYQGAGELREGVNTILVKVAQNEQEDQWAQDWQFQLRVCDLLGGGLLSTDRPSAKN